MKFKINFLILLIAALPIIPYLFRDNEVENEEDELYSTTINDYMQWMNQIRAYPDADIPQEKFYEAFEYSQKYLTNEIDGATSWTSIGPNNIGGRSLCLAIHPVDTATVYIGSSSGGMWKSTTGGLGASAWTLVNTGYPSLAVSSIVIDSINPNVMYIGTGENYGYKYSNNGQNIRVMRGMYGIGILKTTNGGTTWTKSLDWSYNNQRGVWVVTINPKNSNVLYAATSEGVYKSVNAGSTWNQMLNYQMVMDLKLNPVDTSVLYISVGNLTNNVPLTNKGIFKSTNGGVSWAKLAGGLPADWSGKATLELYRGNPDYVYANIANDITTYVGYYKSTNAGATWTLGSTSVPSGNQGWYNQGHIVKPNDPNAILVGTLNVEKSINGGTSFTTKSSWSAWNSGATPPGDPEGPSNFVHADVHSFTINPKDFNKVYIIADGGLYRTNDFGETFYSCNGGYVTSQFYASLGQSSTDSIFCIGGLQDNRTAFYQGTVAWYKTFGGDGFCSQVNSQNNNTCYTEYTYGAISRSTNKGVSWSGLSVPNSGNSTYYCFCAPYICAQANPNILYVGGNGIYKSTNGGNAFTGPYGTFGSTEKVLSLGMSFTGIDTLYCGTIPQTNGRTGIYRSFDAGLTWTSITDTNFVPNRYPTDIHVNRNNPKELYVTFGGFGSQKVIKSTNSGTTWMNITGNLPDVPFQSVVNDPLYQQNVYVGCDLGVYATTNNGANWYEFRTGMPYCLVFDLTIVNTGRKLRATTHGNGIWDRNLPLNPVGINENNNNNNPSGFNLYQNYPNPFNPVTKIKFDIPGRSVIARSGATKQSQFVSLKIFDIIGREITTLVNSELSSGTYEYSFDASKLPSGIYFYQLRAGDLIQTKKMTLLK
jgi:photosystem II stability/assembly factor-like uncharacterized protein